MNMMQPARRKEADSDSNDLHSISTIENPAASAAQSEDSKDSSGLKEEAVPKVPVRIFLISIGALLFVSDIILMFNIIPFFFIIFLIILIMWYKQYKLCLRLHPYFNMILPSTFFIRLF